MPLVRVLPDILASQVAAGEVVERPASVVKELIENSLDAGAKSVMVDLERGGVGLIRVSDDGCGMLREDALLSLERHATSKLRSAEDLSRISTLGFRGEAVPSIASVSKFRMVTRREADLAGTEIFVDGGKLVDVKEAGAAPGTVIEAKNLFFNMPARRKFLKAESTETAHVEQQIRLHALAAPTVRFRMKKEGVLVFDYPGVNQSVDRVRQLVGNELGSELIPIPEKSSPGMSVSGFILPASHARKGRRHQFVFLNGRPIEDSAISKGLTEGFAGSIQEGLHPAAWIWLEMKPDWVDVNVHPAKREVRFHRPFEVRDLLASAVRECLWPVFVPDLSENFTSPDRQPFEEKQEVIEALHFHAAEPELFVEKSIPAIEMSPRRRSIPHFRLLGMFQERYVLLESQDGLVLFDPKAAWERIIFEKLARSQKNGMDTQPLLVPLLFELEPRDIEILLRERMKFLEAGIEFESFGGNTLQIRSLPMDFVTDHPRQLLHEILEELLHGSMNIERFSFEKISKSYAKQAAKLVVPRLAEAMALLEELFQCDLPYCAADGRPTLTEYSRKDIDRRFGLGKN